MLVPYRCPGIRPSLPLRVGACLFLLSALLPRHAEARPGAHPGKAGCLSASADTVDFGAVAVGDSAIRGITLHNACRHAVKAHSIAVSPQAFGTAAEAPFSIPGSGSLPLTVTFAPGDTGSLAGELRIRSTDSRSGLRIVLGGEGAAAWLRAGTLEVSPSRFDETLPSMHAVGRVLSLRNAGEDSLRVSMESVVAPPGTGLDSRVSMLYLLPFEDVYYENNYYWLLSSLRRVSQVDVRSGFDHPPALEDLLEYDIVVVDGGAWADPDSTGNVLADYVDAGGKVILTYPALNPSVGVRGRITGPAYSPVPSMQPVGGWNGGGTTRFVDHPLVEGVTGFWTQSYLPAQSVQGAGQALAYFGDESIAAAYNAERPVAFVNVTTHEGDFTGYYSLLRLYANLVDHFFGTRNWLHVPSPLFEKDVWLAPGETRRIIVPVGHVWGLPEGLHQGVINFYSGRPEILRMPATLTVTAPGVR